MEDVIVGCCVRRTLQSEAKVLKHFFFKGIVWEVFGTLEVSSVVDKGKLNKKSTVVSGQINPAWDCLQTNHTSSSFKTDNLIC